MNTPNFICGVCGADGAKLRGFPNRVCDYCWGRILEEKLDREVLGHYWDCKCEKCV